MEVWVGYVLDNVEALQVKYDFGKGQSHGRGQNR